MTKKIFPQLWVIGSLSLFLYSFTQVDLSLTLSQSSVFQSIQKGFQYIGWFNRPLSTYLYIGVFLFLFMLYFWTIKMVEGRAVNSKKIWKTIFIITLILASSYNAFSKDIFNYIFDARIVTFYQQNPYIHKALDFPSDPMLSFMHWTHRTYPYGPLWLVITIPLTFIGNNFFLATFYLFKILIASFFLLTVWAIGKIAEFLKLNKMLVVAAFAFNPFILTESLVSAHNDIVMMGGAMIGTYYLLTKSQAKGGLWYIFSIGIKFATALLVVGYFVLKGFGKTKYFLSTGLVLMIIAVIIATIRTNFQPWYLLYVAPFACLLFEKPFVRYPFYIFSVANIVYYIPYLHQGTWDKPIPEILNSIIIAAIVASLFSALYVRGLLRK